MKFSTLLRALKYLTGVTAAICVAGLLATLWIYRDIPVEVLEAEYGKPPSQFMIIDGVRIHFRDEGDGTTIVLIHGHWGSLFQWDSWIPTLLQNHRVVRFDLTSHGLTGVDPTGDYTNERAVWLLEQLADRLNLEKFHIAGTSIGGMIAYKYSAANPDRILSLGLINSGGLKNPARGPDDRYEMAWWIDALAYYTPKSVVENILRNVAGDPTSISDDVVDHWYRFNMAEGQREAEIERNRQFTIGRTTEELNLIRSPTLLMWGESNANLPLSQVDEFKSRLINAPVTTVIYEGIGHNVTYENPKESARDYLEFVKQVPADIAALTHIFRRSYSELPEDSFRHKN
ncbi:MAG: alpha/beta hydrolase [Rhodospirillaceae bacterium]